MSNPIPSTCLIPAVAGGASAGARGVGLITRWRAAGTLALAARS